MKHYMLDLETLGTRPGCKILSIGVCEILDVVNKNKFYVEVSRRCDRLFEDPVTVKWWEENKTAHTSHILNWDNSNAVHITDALNMLDDWLTKTSNREDYCVWGNGSDFDNAIIAEAWAAYAGKCPWQFRNNRCFRTLKSLSPEVTHLPNGNKHNALDDAVNQANHMINILKYLKIKL